MPRYDNIFLADVTQTNTFVSPLSGGGGEPKIPHRDNRQAHSNTLLSQFREAQRQFNEYSPEQVAAIQYRTGTYVEFAGAAGRELITKSLEDNRQGIRVMNVRDVLIQNENGEKAVVTRATVYIPAGKEQVFITKIEAFAEEPVEGRKPKNNDLVSSIEEITSAIILSAFWIGRPVDMPSDDKRWYELWLDSTDCDAGKVIEDAFAVMDSLGLEHRDAKEAIIFPERIVMPVFANRNGLLDFIKQGVIVAEVRKPADPNVYFIDSSFEEQEEWANDLLTRTQFLDTGVVVCVLDTGVNNNHSLISPYIPASGMTVNNTWGASDDKGHGTNMAGIVLYNDLKRYLISNEQFNLNHTIESVKILPPESLDKTDVGLYGALTEQASLLAEIGAPTTKRVYCMAITDSTGSTNDGQPSSWSGAIDQMTSSSTKKLFIISAGNVSPHELADKGYPDTCLFRSVEDPAQAWNALTVGAYAYDAVVNPNPLTKNYHAVAQAGELSPYSTTSYVWGKEWPIKPEVVCDGGNVITDGAFYSSDEDLSRLTLNKDIGTRLFDTIHATSAASAQCAYI